MNTDTPNTLAQSPSAPQKSVDNPQITPDSGVQDQMKAVNIVADGAKATDVLTGMEGNEIKESASSSIAENNGDGAVTTQHQKDNAAQDESSVRAQLGSQKSLPTQKVMIRKVKTALAHEMRHVEHQIKKLQKNASKHAHALAEAFRSFRHLREIFSRIKYLAAEAITMLFEKVLRKESLVKVEI